MQQGIFTFTIAFREFKTAMIKTLIAFLMSFYVFFREMWTLVSFVRYFKRKYFDILNVNISIF